MNRLYIICHMVTSIERKVTGDFLYRHECEAATEIYYEMNREYRQNGGSGFICGRITMEQSFTGGWYPDLSKYEPGKPEPVPMKYVGRQIYPNRKRQAYRMEYLRS